MVEKIYYWTKKKRQKKVSDPYKKWLYTTMSQMSFHLTLCQNCDKGQQDQNVMPIHHELITQNQKNNNSSKMSIHSFYAEISISQ